MVGTFGGTLEARPPDASDGKLIAEIRAELESEEGVLVIRRITWRCVWSHPKISGRFRDDPYEKVAIAGERG
jgi:hypothetical protein